jgi:hypothetical protein
MQCYRKVPASSFVNHVCDAPAEASRPQCHTVSSASPHVFGPIAWSFLHTVAENYDAEQPEAQTQCSAWLSSTAAMLPCPNCRGHLASYVAAHPTGPACESRDTLRTYLVDLHNSVNERTGGDPAWTPEQAQARYSMAELCID